MIDLRDTRDLNRPIEFLRYSQLAWDLRTSHQPGRRNRWRRSDYVDAFTRHGLEVVEQTATLTTHVTEQQRASLAPQFRGKSHDDLAVLSFVLVARKPFAATV
jgi:hypothetical protein